MSDQALRQAIRALQTIEAEHHLAAATERRVLSTLRQRAQRGRAIRAAAYLLSFSLCAAASAHAAVRGPAETWHLVAQLWRPFVQEEVGRPKTVRAAPARSLAVAPGAPGREDPAKPVQHVPDSSPAPLAAPALTRAARARPVAGAHDRREVELTLVRAATPQVAPAADALYNEAHQLHFATGDKYAALRAWDAYLAAAPDGTFAPEAHYNRALCLIALGRTDVALTALRSIAAGELTSYRARDADRLVRALEERSR